MDRPGFQRNLYIRTIEEPNKVANAEFNKFDLPVLHESPILPVEENLSWTITSTISSDDSARPATTDPNLTLDPGGHICTCPTCGFEHPKRTASAVGPPTPSSLPPPTPSPKMLPRPQQLPLLQLQQQRIHQLQMSLESQDSQGMALPPLPPPPPPPLIRQSRYYANLPQIPEPEDEESAPIPYRPLMKSYSSLDSNNGLSSVSQTSLYRGAQNISVQSVPASLDNSSIKPPSSRVLKRSTGDMATSPVNNRNSIFFSGFAKLFRKDAQPVAGF